MAIDNKVVWSEGMFLSPQHFQQQERYLERYIDSRCNALAPAPWGLVEYTVDPQLLKIGKISLLNAKGIFPDGTPFNIPESDDPPPVMEVPENTRDTIVYLGLPVRRPGSRDVLISGGGQGLVRYEALDHECRDSSSETGDTENILIGKLRLRLLLETDDLSGYACVGLVRIIEAREDKNIILDNEYIPPCVSFKASKVLTGFVNELSGLLHQRGEAIAGRMVDSQRAGTAQVADYMMLQLVNRCEPLIQQYTLQQGIHPQQLFNHLVQLWGEFSTFTSSTKRPPLMPNYVHDELQASFGPVIIGLRQCLSMVFEQSAISLPLKLRKYGIRVAQITDRTLIDSAQFVLAVKADLPGDAIRARFPAQTTIGPVERIRQLVNVSMSGIQVAPLPVAPRQIPYHSGCVYFELDRNNEFWRELQQSGGFAFHVGGEFPNLELEFWAIRE
ncbi:MAG: type VI secretion system baseplate subunit TssK [Gammaproteobacteria bacterium]|jgi:type VI secretion system protein ImpJ